MNPNPKNPKRKKRRQNKQQRGELNALPVFIRRE